MSWLLSFMSALMLWQMGNKNVAGPVIGIVNQILWFIYVINAEDWGLMPGVLLFTFVHGRNLYRWRFSP